MKEAYLLEIKRGVGEKVHCYVLVNTGNAVYDNFKVIRVPFEDLVKD